jgi:glucose/arabinose dehydrogenase
MPSAGFGAALRRHVPHGVAVILMFAGLTAPGAARAASPELPPGFSDTTVISGLDHPTAVRFSPDGRVFIAEKSGIVKVFASPTAASGATFADLRTEVLDFWDRGLLGLALDPGFPSRPYVYVLYTYDAPLGSGAPVWSDACADPLGNGCVASGRLSRLTAAGDGSVREDVLMAAWCQQYPSHSVGGLGFGPDGALYAGAGDGASFTEADSGDHAGDLSPTRTDQPDVCHDPPRQGGALRSQDLLTRSDALGYDGAIVRLEPDAATGALGPPRIVAEGLRNPFRFAFRPGSDELWVGDVGGNATEEIDRLADPTGFANFGWPCYEGAGEQDLYGAFALCQRLYQAPAGTVTPPYFAYAHGAPVAADDPCPADDGSSISGLAFAPSGTPYPAPYGSALFFADHSRDCIWSMATGADGLPDPASVHTFAARAAHPVDLQFGPDGALYYVDFDDGALHRITWTPGPEDARTTEAATAPTPTIATPRPGAHWRARQSISFAGSAAEPGHGPLPDSALHWTLSRRGHVLRRWNGVAAGRFVAPDPRRPEVLELRLEAVGPSGQRASTSVRLDPSTVRLRLDSRPRGLRLRLDGVTAPAPLSRTVVRRSTHRVAAPRQRHDGGAYRFVRWSDRRPAAHTVVARRSRTLTAAFGRRPPPACASPRGASCRSSAR